MVDARLAAARKAWATLHGFLVQKGWRDKATRLLLFDTFVKTCLLYGVAVWGSGVLARDGDMGVDQTRELGAFYCGALRCIMGAHCSVHNEILYILCGRWPL